MCRQSATVCLAKSPSRQHRALPSLAERLAVLPDPRRRRGVRHPFVAVLLVAACAVTAGARSWTAIGQWARSVPQETLARLGARTVSALGVRVAPSLSTIRRVVGTPALRTPRGGSRRSTSGLRPAERVRTPRR
ncbi:transposase family protein [Streptomyces sp. NPDC006984]|uniref:transposase family protein n=1 Tax=Streptomyces sp. NPDC006984 TaxID=3155463 RepID=UPI0033CE5AE5